MEKLYSLTVRILTILIALVAFNQGVVMSMQQHVSADTSKIKPIKISDYHINKPIFSLGSRIEYKPVSANTYSGIQTPKTLQQDGISTLNVKIYPIPVSDQINMSYHLSKDAIVTIDITSVLGVKLFTLLSQHKPAGEQKDSFPINSRLTSGIYMIRVAVGNQPVVSKRIFVL